MNSTRRRFLAGGAAFAATALGGCATVSPDRRCNPVLCQGPSVDMHAHFLTADALGGFTESHVSGAVHAIIADWPIVARRKGRYPVQVGEPLPDQLYHWTGTRLQTVIAQLRSHDIPVATTAAQVGDGKFAILAIEGGGFANEDLGRIEEMHAAGVRLIQPAHYTLGPFTDIQTREPRYHGLSPRGRELIRELDRLGVIVDTAHMTFRAAEQTLENATRPVVFSHGHVVLEAASLGDDTRAMGTEFARLIASSGGVIGMWPKMSRSRHINTSLAAFARHTVRVMDLLGPDHVGVGSDLGGFRSVMGSYSDWDAFVEHLLVAGASQGDARKLLGGNFMRVFAAATRRAAPLEGHPC